MSKCWRLWVKVDEIDVNVDQKVDEIVDDYVLTKMLTIMRCWDDDC